MTTGIRTGDWVSYQGHGPFQVTEIKLRVGSWAKCILRYPVIANNGIVLKWGRIADVAYNTLEPGARPDLLPGEDDI